MSLLEKVVERVEDGTKSIAQDTQGRPLPLPVILKLNYAEREVGQLLSQIEWQIIRDHVFRNVNLEIQKRSQLPERVIVSESV